MADTNNNTLGCGGCFVLVASLLAISGYAHHRRAAHEAEQLARAHKAYEAGGQKIAVLEYRRIWDKDPHYQINHDPKALSRLINHAIDDGRADQIPLIKKAAKENELALTVRDERAQEMLKKKDLLRQLYSDTAQKLDSRIKKRRILQHWGSNNIVGAASLRDPQRRSLYLKVSWKRIDKVFTAACQEADQLVAKDVNELVFIVRGQGVIASLEDMKRSYQQSGNTAVWAIANKNLGAAAKTLRAHTKLDAQTSPLLLNNIRLESLPKDVQRWLRGELRD